MIEGETQIVSRETIADLELYGNLLKKWQAKINLVSSSTLPYMWERHFQDSFQLLSYLPHEKATLIDLGSGGGFPGLVIALCLRDRIDVTLIEADLRKCLFLENVSRETFLDVKILRSRIENVPSLKKDVVTARALAPLPRLLKYASRFMTENSIGLFLKGKEAMREIEEAGKTWNFSLEIFESLTDPDGRILQISNLEERFPHG